MKKLVRIGMFGLAGLLMTSCGTPQTAAERMVENEYRNEVYAEIVKSENRFEEFMQVAQNDPEAQKWLLQAHFDMMEAGKVEILVKNNPQLKDRMRAIISQKLENDPEMQAMLKDKVKAQMMQDPEVQQHMMQHMHEKMKNNPEMADKMMDNMIQFLHENPQLMDKMRAKMKAHQEEMKAQNAKKKK